MREKDRSVGVIPVLRTLEGLKYLLIQHKKKGHWAFPKGHQEAGESDLQTALRELKEETGITNISILPEITFTEQYTFTHFDGRVLDKTVVYFVGFTQETDVSVQKSEVQDYEWLPLQEAREKITYDESKALLDSVNAFLKSRSY